MADTKGDGPTSNTHPEPTAPAAPEPTAPAAPEPTATVAPDSTASAAPDSTASAQADNAITPVKADTSAHAQPDSTASAAPDSTASAQADNAINPVKADTSAPAQPQDAVADASFTVAVMEDTAAVAEEPVEFNYTIQEGRALRKEFDRGPYLPWFIGLWTWVVFSNVAILLFSFGFMPRYLDCGSENPFAVYSSLAVVAAITVAFELFWLWDKKEFWEFLPRYAESAPPKISWRVMSYFGGLCGISKGKLMLFKKLGQTAFLRVDLLQDIYFVEICRTCGFKEEVVIAVFAVGYAIQHWLIIFAPFKACTAGTPFAYGHGALYPSDLVMTQEWCAKVWYKTRGGAFAYYSTWPVIRLVFENIPQLVLQVLFLYVGPESPDPQTVIFVMISVTFSTILSLVRAKEVLYQIDSDWFDLWWTEHMPDQLHSCWFTEKGLCWQEPLCQIGCCFCFCCPYKWWDEPAEATPDAPDEATQDAPAQTTPDAPAETSTKPPEAHKDIYEVSAAAVV